MTWVRTFLCRERLRVDWDDHGRRVWVCVGRITPDFFRRVIPWQDVEPVGMATFLGATAAIAA